MPFIFRPDFITSPISPCCDVKFFRWHLFSRIFFSFCHWWLCVLVVLKKNCFNKGADKENYFSHFFLWAIFSLVIFHCVHEMELNQMSLSRWDVILVCCFLEKQNRCFAAFLPLRWRWFYVKTLTSLSQSVPLSKWKKWKSLVYR